MDSTSLMNLFADPGTIKNLSILQRFVGGLITTFLGMGITFICLGILQFVIGLFDKLNSPVRQSQTFTVDPVEAPPAVQQHQDEEIVAAITAALAVALQTPADKIVIRNIRQTEEISPPWSRAGRLENLLGNG